MTQVLRTLSSGVLVAAAACTYGPVEEHASATQIVRLGDSYRAVAVVQREVFQRPTGLNTFPDGGRGRFLERHASQFLLDADAGRAVRLASQEASESLWESFSAHIAGVEGDSAVYLRLTGCPRGGECYPDLSNQMLQRLTTDGSSTAADRVPDDAILPGTMLARRPGEQNYVRFTVSGDTIEVRLEDDGPYRPAFRVEPSGAVVGIGP